MGGGDYEDTSVVSPVAGAWDSPLVVGPSVVLRHGSRSGLAEYGQWTVLAWIGSCGACSGKLGNWGNEFDAVRDG